MELGKKIYELRKLSGMTQEQLAEKLNVSRQTLSKWENESSMPDVESVVNISALFHTSLEELLTEERNRDKEQTKITLEDMMQINAHNRKMNLLLCSGLLFLAIGIMLAAFEEMLESTMDNLQYILFRYMVTGRYEAVPMNYVRLQIPALLAGIVGVALCLCYAWKNREGNGKNGERTGKTGREEEIGKKPEGERSMKKVAHKGLIGILVILAVAGGVFLTVGRDRKVRDGADNADRYGEIIAGLGDEEQYSLQDIGEKGDVLFTTDATYDDGNGHNASICCSVYYEDDGMLYSLERIESLGTAYPVSVGDKCIYTASEHGVTVYTFDRKTSGWSVSAYEEIFDEAGDATYVCTKNGVKETISGEEYRKITEGYGESSVVNFGYGASDNPW